MQIKTLSLVVLSLIGLSGCVVSLGDDVVHKDEYSHNWKNQEQQNREHLNSLLLGMAVTQVVTQMGTADFNEAYQRAGQATQVLFYRTQRKHGDGDTTKDECTPLVFTNGKLVGWGAAAYQQYVAVPAKPRL